VADHAGVQPVVTEPGSATLEPALETNDPDVGVNRRLDPEVQAVDGTTAAPAPIAGARRRLSPRPVPGQPAQETAGRDHRTGDGRGTDPG
jgi:hypothetical protein